MSDFNIQFEEQDQSITLEFEQIGGGAVKSVNGKTGAVVLDAGDLEYDDTETYSSGSVGDAISDVKNDFDDLDDRVTALEQGGSGSGLTDDIKQALLQIADKVAYIDEDGQDYYDDLYDALYPPAPPAELVSISAVYTQSGTVYNTDTLDSLKTDLVVTALYDDQTTATVTEYTLSGTLTVGTSTITVTYGGKTTAFNVTVSSDADEPIIITDRTYTSGYIDDSGNIKASSNNYVSNMYIPITGNIIVDFTKTRSDVSTCRIAEYDSSQGFIKRSYVSAANRGGASGFVLDSNTAYVRVGFVTSAPQSVFENFEVMRNTGISNYLYYESGSIDSSGNETTSTARVRSGYISLSNNTSAFAVLYSSISNTTAQLKLYNSSKVYSAQTNLGSYYENTGTEYPFARLIYGISNGTLGNVDDSAIVIDGTIYRLKAGDVS